MINSQLLSALFILLLALSPVLGYFEYLQLVLQWPTTFCRTKYCPRKQLPINFTIHGLWPDNKSTMLNNCDFDGEYDDITEPHKLKELEDQWPDLTSMDGDIKKHQDFWGYEFTKHGSCSIDLYNQEAYFDLALKLKNMFDLLKILKNHGIIPGKIYTVKNVEDAIKAVSTKAPNLNCIGRYTQTMKLLEIGICFDREATQVIDCRRRWKSHPKGNQKITLP